MTLAEAIAFLQSHDRTEVLSALKADAKGVYQSVFQEGHDVGYGKKAGELSERTTKITGLEAQITALETKVRELGEKSPDVAKLHEQYAAQIRELTATKDAEVAKARGELDGVQLTGGIARLRAAMIKLGMDPDYAEAQLERPGVRARIKHEGSGKLSILQAGKDIPIAGENSAMIEDAFAKELFEATPAKFRTSNADSGAGDTTTKPDGKGEKKNLFDQIREDVASEQKAETERNKQVATVGGENLVLGTG